MKYIKSIYVERVGKSVDNCLTEELKTDTIRSASLMGLSIKTTNFLKIRYV